VLRNDILPAKVRQREVRANAEPSSTPNANNKRPLAVTLATSTSPTAPSKRAYERKEGDDDGKPLKKNSRLSNYFEYDLSKMVNTKGGFLVDEDGGPGKEVDEEVQRREKLREKERIAKNAEPCGFFSLASGF
jgi:DNA-repair protein complementing XP-A cells